MSAQRIGIREAKIRFSRLIDDVRRGVEWVITDRGRPVAKLTVIADEDLSAAERVAGLERTGAIGPPHPGGRPLPPPLPVEQGLAQRYLQQDRGA